MERQILVMAGFRDQGSKMLGRRASFTRGHANGDKDKDEDEDDDDAVVKWARCLYCWLQHQSDALLVSLRHRKAMENSEFFLWVEIN